MGFFEGGVEVGVGMGGKGLGEVGMEREKTGRYFGGFVCLTEYSGLHGSSTFVDLLWERW